MVRRAVKKAALPELTEVVSRRTDQHRLRPNRLLYVWRTSATTTVPSSVDL